MCLASNDWGYSLIDFIDMQEENLLDEDKYFPITCCLVVIDYNGKIVLVSHKKRKQWELPGGTREEGETPKECAKRELYEETNQSVDDLEFLGLAKLFDANKGKIEFLALYYQNLYKFREFNENQEIKELILWNMKDEIGMFDGINKYLLKACVENRLGKHCS